mmetsp:Transcript_69057/g.192959  ORF Transcript_69057/g.192959 Transcript_69057/m.192959 type:complete len:135 (-) Transcript_69057:45-449(-)
MAEKGDLAKGRARWEETKAWRASGGIDTILSTPHPKFDLIKSIYPHCFHMRSKEGLCVYYEKPGMIDFKRMKDLGVTIEELLQHRIFLLEYQVGIPGGGDGDGGGGRGNGDGDDDLVFLSRSTFAMMDKPRGIT